MIERSYFANIDTYNFGTVNSSYETEYDIFFSSEREMISSESKSINASLSVNFSY